MLTTLRSLAKKLFSRKLSPAPARRRPSFRVGLEMLEDRLVLAASPWQAPFFAPYVNTFQQQQDQRFNDYATAAQNAGTKYLTLGFITADAANQPSWEGQAGLGSDFDLQMQTQVANLRAQGGDVMISFGGAAGTELGQAIHDPNQLQQAYQQVIDAYSLTHVDFDIEGNAARDNSAALDCRSQAIAGLEQWAAAQGKELQVYLTLPTSSSGLMANEGLNVLDSALKNGVKLAGVNIMTMDYADFVNYDGVNGPTMGDAAINAARGLFGQLKTELAQYGQDKTDAQVWQLIDLTPQIGTNVQYVDGVFHGTEVFTLDDAAKVVDFARNQGLGRLSFWAIGCDQNPNNITNDPNPNETYSGVPQQPFDFSRIFEQFQGAALAPVNPPVNPPVQVPNSPPPANLAQVASALTHSQEHYTQFVTQAYQQYLGHSPDAPGLNAWVNAMMVGSVTDERLEAGIIGSAEYIANHGGAGRGWVVGMYQDLLGRTPAEEEVQGWLNALDHGVSETTVAYSLAASQEREGIRVRGDYRTYLGRDASAAEVNSWVNAFLAGFSNEDVVAAFVGSQEYYNSNQKGQGNRAVWIAMAYEQILGRTPSADECNGWLAVLA
jgi:hypothetical protein